ncbi:hypothetical protein TD95_003068 [Thielaviopsis punctulata]|uniref:Major facilitator superfamily (MFS) profile domain-containing protein n=1 Tax=Thielaviopsis punctulata TaxID=72032 RepID=A0A0F4ZJ22_9PEZI|nr:hypothetical protein TD95_003068 [Thielaviopsis punctulata]
MIIYTKVIRPLMDKARQARRDANPKKDPVSCVHQPDASFSACSQCVSERRASTHYRIKIVIGLMLAFWLQALDLTIISPILLEIAQVFNATSEFSWVISSFTLVSAAFIPFWGQMADVFGRHRTLQTSLLLVTLGSALCTASPSSAFGMLLFGRSLQGLGCSGISVLIRIIIADRVSLKENAVTWSWFSIAGGIAYGVGPQIGSKLAEASWRWCFAISIAVAVVAMLLLFCILRADLLGPQPIQLREKNPYDTLAAGPTPDHLDVKASLRARLGTIDVGGQLLFIIGLALFVLGLTWGGATYPWRSAAVLVPLVSGTLLLAAFCVWERSMDARRFLGRRFPQQKPMIPWAVLSDRNIVVLFFSGFVYSMTTYAIIYYCPIYLSVVKGQSASEAGRAILFFLPGLGLGAWASIFLCNKWPRMTIVPIIGGAVVELVGVVMLAVALNMEKVSVIYAMMSLASGGGALRIMASSLHGIGMFRNNIPAVVSLQLLSSPLGGTLGVTIMSVIFNNVANINLNVSGSADISSTALQPGAEAAIIHKAKMGLVYAIVSIVPFSALCVLSTLTLGNVRLPKGSESREDQMHHEVVREPYLWMLIRGQKNRDCEASHVELQSTSDGSGHL